MTRRGRVLGSVVATLLVVGGVVYALAPFDHTISTGGEAWSDGPGRGPPITAAIRGECRAAAVSATRDGPPLELWAVTVGTDLEGYTPVFGDDVKMVLLDGTTDPDSGVVDLPDRACSTRARERLVASALFISGGVAIGFLALRRRRVIEAAED